MDERFLHDRFLIDRQPLTLGDRYQICDEAGTPLFRVRRDVFKLHANIHVCGVEDGGEVLAIYDRSILDTNATMEVRETASEEFVGSFKRKLPASFWRSKWELRDAWGAPFGAAAELSTTRAVLRRLLGRRPARSPVRSDFTISLDGRVVGKFVRRRTFPDRYLLDLSSDRARLFDRRLAVALGIVLDSAEKR